MRDARATVEPEVNAVNSTVPPSVRRRATVWLLNALFNWKVVPNAEKVVDAKALNAESVVGAESGALYRTP